MEIVPVSSSNVAAVGYEEGVLQVHFSNGSVYNYFGVPEYIFAEVLIANSVGAYLRENVFEKFDHEKIC